MVTELLDTATYISYFRQVAEEAVFIDNFFYTYDQMVEKSKTVKKGTIMVLEPYTNVISEATDDNALAMRKGLFVIIRQYSGLQDIPNVQGQCELLCYKLIGRIKRDSKNHILRSEIRNFNGNETPPVGQGFVGYAIEFSFHAPINRFMKFEEADWIITPPTPTP